MRSHVQNSAGSYELVLSAVALGLIGLLVDRQVGTTPVFTIVLTVLGFVGATLSLYYRYRHQIARLESETAELRTAARTAPVVERAR